MVATGLLGADWTSGRWTTGLLVTHSLGDGSYRGADTSAVTSTLTGVWPWVRHALDDRLSVWGVAGLGGGRLTLEPRDADGARAGDDPDRSRPPDGRGRAARHRSGRRQ